MPRTEGFNDVVNLLKDLIQEQGAAILQRPNMVIGYLEDCKIDNQTLMTELKGALESQAASSLLDASRNGEITQATEEMISLLQEKYLWDKNHATEAVELVSAVLNISMEMSEKPRQYQEASNQVSARELNEMGNRYRDGDGVTQDYKEAISCYQKALVKDPDYAPAQENMGKAYLYGNGVNCDYKEAVKWFQKAANQGYADAQNDLGNCYYAGYGVNKDYNEAFEFFQKAAVQNNARSQANLGSCYEYGEGVSQDYNEAVKWYQKSADQDYAFAQYAIGKCYQKGLGVEQDISEAIKWYRKSADQGYSMAQEALKNLYADNQQGSRQQGTRQQESRQQEVHTSQGYNRSASNVQTGAESYYHQMEQQGFSICNVSEQLDYEPDYGGDYILRGITIETPWLYRWKNIQAEVTLDYSYNGEIFDVFFEYNNSSFLTKRLNNGKASLEDESGNNIDIRWANSIIIEMARKTITIPCLQSYLYYMQIEKYRAEKEGTPTPSIQSYLNFYLPEMEDIIRNPSRVIFGSFSRPTLEELEMERSRAQREEDLSEGHMQGKESQPSQEYDTDRKQSDSQSKKEKDIDEALYYQYLADWSRRNS